MARYAVYMHLSLLDAVPKSGLQRRKIMDFIYSLREHPDTPGDFTDKDSSLRERQIKVIGDYAITIGRMLQLEPLWSLMSVQRTSNPPNLAERCHESL